MEHMASQHSIHGKYYLDTKVAVPHKLQEKLVKII